MKEKGVSWTGEYRTEEQWISNSEVC